MFKFYSENFYILTVVSVVVKMPLAVTLYWFGCVGNSRFQPQLCLL